MCQIQLLNQNELGCVMCCSVSNDIHLGFGMMLYILNPKEFKNLSGAVNILYNENYGDMMLSGKKVFLNTHNENMILAFNADELRSLWMLINGAIIMFEARKILKILN